MPYSSANDLLLGDMPLSAALDKGKFVQDAADEMDGSIGSVYVLPLPMDTLPDYIKLHLKRINNFLATGRLILAIDVGGEDSQLHAYGLSLVREAKGAIKDIVDGDYALPGATKTNPTAAGPGPSVVNTDASSGVDAFYGFVSTPRWMEPDTLPGYLWAPGPS